MTILRPSIHSSPTSPNAVRPPLRLHIATSNSLISSPSKSIHFNNSYSGVISSTTGGSNSSFAGSHSSGNSSGSSSSSSQARTSTTTMRQFPPPRPTPIQTQTPAVQSLRSAHSSLWGSEPPSAVDEHMSGAGASDEGRPSGDGASLPSFLRMTVRETQAKFIDLEWQQRGRLNDDQWSRLHDAETIRRNRYANVDPYEKNRVALKVPEGHSDYINASHIQLQSSKSGQTKTFIATQGPKFDSFSHIWRMIWDETSEVAVVVMLTQTHEMGKEKCSQYFPLDASEPEILINESDEFGDGLTATLTLESIREDVPTRSTIRELQLRTASGQTKKVYHLLFAGWPDFLIPEGSDRQALVNLIRKSHDLAGGSSIGSAATNNPRIVHCSAGVGRTGTFIALDWLLDELEEGSLDDVTDGSDPISGVVDRLRQQRMMMVQGEQQFTFLYDVVRQAYIERWKSRNNASS